MKASYWHAKQAKESKKLASAQSGWNLAGKEEEVRATRTRNGGFGRPDLAGFVERRHQQCQVSWSDEDSLFTYESINSSEETDVSPYISEDDMIDKPSNSRVLLEVSSLSSAIEENSVCPTCSSRLMVLYDTVCLATSVSLKCKNARCPYIYHGESPAKANIQTRNFPFDNRERNTDYAINILYVLGFLSVGDGSVEAARLCGLLSLPRDTSMEARSYPLIEERLAPAIKELGEEMLHENLLEEVRAANAKLGDAALDENDLMLWQQSLEPDANFVLNRNKYPRIKCSFDMGWQQKGSGHVFNSLSGHALFVGAETRKPISLGIKSRKCSHCDQKRKNLPCGPIEKHDCCKNHTGSSAAMEAQSCLDQYVYLFDTKHVIIDTICLDDDASTRAILKWSNEDHMLNNNVTTPPLVPKTKGKNKGELQVRPDRGLLPRHVPEPSFVADPNHRRKVLTGDLIKLKNQKVEQRHTMTRMDCTRIGKNFGYMLRSIREHQDESKYDEAAKAVLEHHFDNHQYCGPWCRRKNQTDEQKKKRFFRNKHMDLKLYKKLQEIVGRFTTMERLKEVAHNMDTQVNESFNNTASWFAPKNKVYCGTRSLWSRLYMAVGINSFGFAAYFTRLFEKLGIVLEPSVLYFFKQKDLYRTKRLESLKTVEKKKLRMERKFEQLRNDEIEARTARAKRNGTYRRGMNMDEGDSSDNGKEDDGTRGKPQRKKKKRSQVICPFCKKIGHSTTRSKKCDMNAANVGAAGDGIANLKIDGDVGDGTDQDAMDSMPLTYYSDSDGVADLFYDVGTWSDDEEDPYDTALV